MAKVGLENHVLQYYAISTNGAVYQFPPTVYTEVRATVCNGVATLFRGCDGKKLAEVKNSFCSSSTSTNCSPSVVY